MTEHAEMTGYLFEYARDIILVIDPTTGALVDANLAAVAAYGYSRAELLGMNIFELRVALPAEVEQQMRVANREGVLFDTLHRRKDGSTLPVEVSSRGQDIGGRRLLFSIVRDASERKQFEQERESLLAATQRALALRDEFLMIAAHELRAPVTNFILQLEQLQRSLVRGASSEPMTRASALALRESRRLAALVDMLLGAQIDKTELALQLETFDLRDLANEVIERMRVQAHEMGSQITCELTRVHGRWDRLRIDQVLTNLLHNAVKYGRARPVFLCVRGTETRAIIEVVDEGVGVAQDDVPRILEKFERAMPASYGGLGLGLFIARQIVEAHHGEIVIESVPGKGSRVRVELPR
ncbi:MAG TPA: PAS domain-containing sensor histidine kinase [Kofleriaceae bacterium]